MKYLNLIEERKQYRSKLVDQVTDKLLRVLKFIGVDEVYSLVIDYRNQKSKSISGRIQKLYYVNKKFNYIKVDMDYGEYSRDNMDICDLDTTDLEIILFNNFCGYYKNNNYIKLSGDYEN